MAEALPQTLMHCFECGGPLNLVEMHFYDKGDGQASCEECEMEWTAAMSKWERRVGPFPIRARRVSKDS